METREQIYGFEVKAKKYVKEIEGNIYQLEHLKTGAQVIIVDNPDEKKSFLAGFRTVPEDDTGVFHILEHSVLNGSRRYPDPDIFVNLMKHSMAEFVNALTYPDHTVYPFCTENEKDFMNLMDVYLDAVFYPKVLTDKAIYEQEGWHFENIDGDEPKISGVVYNEMKGVFSSLDNMLTYEISGAMFPENPYRYVSGGNPDAIPALSYEKFLERYRRHYNASNCCIILYGRMNVEEKLDYINRRYLGEMAKSEGPKRILPHRPVNVSRRKSYDQKKFGDQGAYAAYACRLADFDDRERMNAVYVLFQALMGEDEAPLKKAVLQELGIPEVQYFIMDGIRQPYLAITIKNAKKETAYRLGEVLKEQASRICGEGIGERLLLSAINQQEFWRREKGGYQPDGIDCVLDLAAGWSLGTEPCKMLEFEETYQKLRERVKEGYFESLLTELILENEHQAEVILEPSENEILKETCGETVEERMAKGLFTLSAEDLETGRKEPATQSEEESGIIFLKHEILSNSVIYCHFYFDISNLEPEEVPDARLLSEVLGELPTKKHTLEELVVEKNMWLGNANNYLEAYTKADDLNHVNLKFVTDVSCLEQNLKKALALEEELLYDTILDQPEVLLKKIRQSRMDLEEGFITSGSVYAAGRAAAHYLLEGAARERYNGISYYQFLGDLLKNFDEDHMAITRKLEGIREKLCCKTPLVMSFTGTEEAYAEFRRQLGTSKFCGGMRAKEAVWYQDELLPGKAEAFTIPSEVSYAAFGGIGEYSGEARLLGRMVSFDYLWSRVRAKGGAYGCGMAVNGNGSWTMSSYRDPNVKKTLETFRGASNWLEALKIEAPELLNYKIGAAADYDRIPKKYVQAKRMDSWYLREEGPQIRADIRKRLLNVSKEELKNRYPDLERFAGEGIVCVLGNKEKINEAAEEFDTIMALIE